MRYVMPKKYNDPKLTDSQVQDITNQVRASGKVDSWSISMAYGTCNGLYDNGVLKEDGGYIVLAQNEIDRQIEQVQQSNDPAIRLHGQMLEDCTKGDWLEQLVMEDEKHAVEQKAALVEYHKQLGLAGEVLTIEGLACVNLERNNDTYWCFVGSYENCFAGQQVLLHEHLIKSTIKQNSNNAESWKLIVSNRFNKGYIETSSLRQVMERVA